MQKCPAVPRWRLTPTLLSPPALEARDSALLRAALPLRRPPGRAAAEVRRRPSPHAEHLPNPPGTVGSHLLKCSGGGGRQEEMLGCGAGLHYGLGGS